MGELNRTFTKPISVADRRHPSHVGHFYSNDMELSCVICWCGWENYDTDAEATLNAWRTHINSLPETTL